MSRWWARVPLLARLWLAVAIAIGVAGGVRIALYLDDARAAAEAQATRSVNLAAALLVPLLTDAAITGDYGAASEMLHRVADSDPALAVVEWVWGRSQMKAESVPKAVAYPPWFARWSGVEARLEARPVQAGGVSYGQLMFEIEPVGLRNAIWAGLLRQLEVVALAMLVATVLVGAVLYSSLAGLRELMAAIQRFGLDPSARAQPRGSPETRRLAEHFNRMADEVAAALSALREARAHWQEQARLNQATLLAIADAVIVCDADARIVQMNGVAERLTGWPLAQALGRPVAEVFRTVERRSGLVQPDVPTAAMHFDAPLGHGRSATLATRDGSLLPIEANAAPVRGPQGERYGGVLVFRDRSQQEQAQQRLAWQATHDALTGLPNRALFADRLREAIAHSEREPQLVAVGLFDLDRFKPINDRLGHAAGDELLRQVALRAEDVLRETDTLARLGGDEFAFVLPQLRHVDEAEAITGRLLSRLAEPFDLGAETVSVSASIGYTLYPLDPADADLLLRHADQAMYTAKHAGRACAHLYDASSDAAEAAFRAGLKAVRHALERHEFEWFYQPKVDMRRGTVAGFEALVRWRHPEPGLLAPQEFLPYLSTGALAIELGVQALDAALTQLETWQAEGLRTAVAVNIAPDHFTAERFVADVRAALARHPGCAPGQLEIEIVESAAIEDVGHAARVIAAIQALGVSVALDDFGSGYASLSYLKRLPVDTLKIDQGFVRDLLDDGGDLALVEAITALGNVFGKRIVAEGVELAEQGVVLMRLGCEQAQGYGIARPMPGSEAAAWCRRWRPDASWALWADTQWELSDFPLLVAQYDHLRWIKAVLATLDGGPVRLDADELEDHHACRLGHWYDTHGQRRYGALPAYRELAPVHAEVHRVGRALVAAANAGDRAGAATLALELLALKDRVLEMLARLQQEVLHHAAP